MNLLAQDGNIPAGHRHLLPVLATRAQPLLGSCSPRAASPAASEPSATTLVQEDALPRMLSLRERMSLFMADADLDSLMQELCMASAPGAVPGPGPGTQPAPLASRPSLRELLSQHSSPCAGSAAPLSVYDSPCSSLGDGGGAYASLGSSPGGGAQALLQGGSFGTGPEPEGRVKAGRLHHRFSGAGSPSASSLSPTRGDTYMYLSASAGMAAGDTSSRTVSPPTAWDFPMPPPSMWPEPLAVPETRARAFAFSSSDRRPRLTHSQSMSHRTLSLSAQCQAAAEPKPGPGAALIEPKVRGGSNNGCGVARKDCRVRGGTLPGQEAAAQQLSNQRARFYFPTVRSTCSIPELQELESLLERGFCSAPLEHALAVSSSSSMRQSLDIVCERTSSEGLAAAAAAGAEAAGGPPLLPPQLPARDDGDVDGGASCPLQHALSLPAQGAGFRVKLFRGASFSRGLGQEPGPESVHALSCDP